MLSVIANWGYMAFTLFMMGYLFSHIIKKISGYEIKSISGIISAGIVAATVYSQIFSCFHKVGAAANVIMLSVCIAAFAALRKGVFSCLAENMRHVSRFIRLGIPVLILIWAFCASRGYMHYDSDLYHAQSIRWIEEYGVVKGLGNIHLRFAYNSSFFALSALYSMRFLGCQSLHAVNGFLTLMLSVEVLGLSRLPKLKKIRLSDFARLAAFYYLTTIYGEITSPASDYAIMCAVFFIIIKWLSLTEENTKSAAPYALICVGCVYAITLKLTAGFILLLVVKPACMLIKEKRWKDIVIYIFMGVAVILPWIIRNIIISGYLLYPFPELDIFNVDWKIPAEMAAIDAAEIKTWGRGLYNSALVNLPITDWFPHWFSETLPALGKLFIVLDILCIILLIAAAALKPIRTAVLTPDNCLAIAAVAASYIFWQLSAPLLRYGYAYVLLMIFLTVGILAGQLCGKKAFWKVFIAFLALFSAVKFIALARHINIELKKPYYVKQQDYGVYELDSFEINGARFYYPQSGDKVGYDAFPAIPRKMSISLIGADIADGFKSASD